jgi:hypothetical protein
MYGWMKNGMPITYEYDFSFFIHPSSHPWFSILESSKRAWRGFSWPFGILWTLLCCGLGQGRGATTRERERERERAMAGLSLQCAACKAQFRSVEEAQEHAELTKHADFQESTEPVRVCYCYCCFVFFPSCFLMSILVADLLSWTRRRSLPPHFRVCVFSLLSSSAYQVCRSALLKSFWMDPLSNETYFCSSFVVNTSRLVSGPFFCCCMTNSVLIMKKAAAAILIFFP